MTEQDTEFTPVVFRADRSGPFKGDVTAVFPCEPSDPFGFFMSCYTHVGQYSGCGLDWYQRTRAARPDEYAALLTELISIGYRPKVYRRITAQHLEALRAASR
jgi:hypothetical protein